MADPVSFGITVALNAAVMGMSAMKKIEGPRLQDLTVSTADYGTPLPSIYGTRRLECLCFYAEEIREEKEQNKTKGGKYTEYKYFGTWANFLCDHEILKVLQIWLDRHLVYDTTGTAAGPLTPLVEGPFGIEVKIGLTDKLRIYLGTEDQLPDHRMVATIDEKEGPGRCPAYLGVSYLMWEDVPLEKFGNRLPQCSARMTRSPPEGAYPYDQLPLPNDGDFISVSPNFRRVLAATFDYAPFPFLFPIFTIVDVATRSIVSHCVAAVGGGGFALADNGTIWGTTPFAFRQWTAGGLALAGPDIPIDGVALGIVYTFSSPLGQTIVTGGPGGEQFYWTNGVDSVKVLTPGWQATGFFRIGDSVHGVGTDFSSTGHTYITDMAGTSTELPVLQVDNAVTQTEATQRGDGRVVIFCEGVFALLNEDRDDFEQTYDTRLSAGGVWQRVNFIHGSDSAYFVGREFDLANFRMTDRADNFTLWPHPENIDGNYINWDPVNHAWFGSVPSGLMLTWRFADRGDEAGEILGNICADVAQLSGMDPLEFDFTDLDQVVPGHSWTQGAGKDIIGALLEIYDSDIRPHGFIQEGLKRGQPLSGPTISTEWMVNDSRGDGSEPLYSIPIVAETDLPRRVFATYADPTMDEQPNTAAAQRNASSVKTNRELSFDLSTTQWQPDAIQPLLERALRRYWVGATKPEFRLTPLEVRLEPGDVRTLLLEDGERLRCRATRVTVRANRVLDTRWEVDGEVQVNPPEWEDDDASPLTRVFPSPGGYTNGRPPDVIPNPAATKGFMIDTPLFADSHDQTSPFTYVAAAPAFAGFWPGALAWISESDDLTEHYAAGFESFASTEGVAWGFATAVLPDALTGVIDHGSQLTLYMPNDDALASITEDEMLESQAANLAFVGGELIQFQTATQTADKTWLLTDLIRGVRGTEYATADHAAGETFVLVSSLIRKHSLGASKIGDTDYYRFSTTGFDLADAETVTETFEANAHRPLSVAHLALTRDLVTHDWLVEWTRRTRIGGSTINGQDVPLGETSELYRVKIMDGDDVLASYDTLTPSKLYTSAEQTSDWGSFQTALTVEVVQISPALSLEGFTATASA